jgi:oligopeptide/dipeptide ABC transporter ATP-binding protein
MEVNDMLMTVKDLSVVFETDLGPLQAVRGVSFELKSGKTLGIVGESGSGKTALARALMGIVQKPPGRIASGSVVFEGRDLVQLSEREMEDVRGRQIGFIFQDPMVSLNPVMRVGLQVAEGIYAHDSRIGKVEVRQRVLELFKSVRLPNPDRCYSMYPHEMSGGMRQRVQIAIAVANSPRLVIADEPTTALDVTVQAQVLETLKKIQTDSASAMIFISHDLALMRTVADQIIVMYAGRIVEQGDANAVLDFPKHPYTAALLAAAPTLDSRGRRLSVIPGSLPSPLLMADGCSFEPRCYVSGNRAKCAVRPALAQIGKLGHLSACHFSEEVSVNSMIVGDRGEHVG